LSILPVRSDGPCRRWSQMYDVVVIGGAEPRA
jgi:hypothetical protein